MMALSALAPRVRDRPGPAGQRGCGVWGHWLFAIADSLSGHTAGMGTAPTAMLFSGGRAALAHVG